jgi:glycosyltransferase involved in cell wall biosynthesis
MINNSVKRILHVANRTKPEKYNILTFPTHERYETQLAKTGHNFYSFHLPNLKKWNKNQIKPPENYWILPESQACEYIQYDFILSQSKFWQFQVAQQISPILNIPIISLEHTLPTPQTLNPEQINMMRGMVGDINIFISEYSQKTWGIGYNTDIIHHGIDTETFKPNPEIQKENHILTVANDFINRDYCLNYRGWKRVTDGLPTKLVGDTKGLSVSASSTEELVNDYNTCSVYFNSSTISPIPTSLLEAMSCGCAIVSTATCMIPEIIQNGVNGFISNDENELRKYVTMIMEDGDLRASLGKEARKTILEKFSQEKFISKWNDIFDQAYEVSIK